MSRPLHFEYDEGPVVTYLKSVTQAGYVRNRDQAGHFTGKYTRAYLPSLDFGYVKPDIHDELSVVDRESLEGVNSGVETSGAQWVDIDGEGIPGVLLPTERAWFYKPNLGNGRLAPPALMRSLPAPAELTGAQQLEVDKTYFAIESELARLVALAVNPGALEKDVTPLAELEGGKLRTRVHTSRGHCSKIWNIYERDLKRWFEKVLNPTEVVITQEIFETLRNEDQALYELLEPLATFISDEARSAMDVLTGTNPDFEAVKKRLLQARGRLRPVRERLNAIANQLGSLRQEFIEVSGAV